MSTGDNTSRLSVKRVENDSAIENASKVFILLSDVIFRTKRLNQRR